MVGKVRAGHLGGRHAPCSFPFPPCHPPAGDFPPATPSGGSRGRARAFLCSSPVTAPAFSLPHSGKGVAGPFLCPRSGTALANPRAVFSFPAADPRLSRSVCAVPSPAPAASPALSPLVGCRSLVPAHLASRSPSCSLGAASSFH